MTPVLAEYQARIESVLDDKLRSTDCPAMLEQAMRYSTLDGGKRIRAGLVYAAGLSIDAPLDRLDSVAAVVECMHAYSLIHDDLPAMDDDALRRGKATNHLAFNEATAILAGDALQALAFELIVAEDSGLNDAQCRIITATLARAAGRDGMVGGQFLDTSATGNNLTQAELEAIHHGKTGALISAAVLCGGYCSDKLNNNTVVALSKYARNLGLAFQIIDDVLDVNASTEQLGKQSGADAALGKTTYPDLLGLEESKQLAEKLYHEAIASAATISDNTAHLQDVASLIVQRQF